MKNRITEPSKIIETVSNKLKEAQSKNSGVTSFFKQMWSTPEYEAADICQNVPIFNYILNAFYEQSPWMKECFDYMPQKQVHEGYANNWWAYNNSARIGHGNISKYQFRDPKEEFAEMFSVYYCKDNEEERKNSLGEERYKWFVDSVVKEREPEKFKTIKQGK